MNFQVGDKVTWCGVEGIVVTLHGASDDYPLTAIFPGMPEPYFEFTADGKYHKDHTEPSLILVERQKKKVKKTFYQAVVKNGQYTWFYSMLFNSPESLNSYWLPEGQVVIGMHKIELEVEE